MTLSDASFLCQDPFETISKGGAKTPCPGHPYGHGETPISLVMDFDGLRQRQNQWIQEFAQAGWLRWDAGPENQRTSWRVNWLKMQLRFNLDACLTNTRPAREVTDYGLLDVHYCKLNETNFKWETSLDGSSFGLYTGSATNAWSADTNLPVCTEPMCSLGLQEY
ncbi:hypothetical protein T09_6794 [Trichinella sp. T9]|nr:hypothetical protein T09_6794 [Trichinella sp. T9]